MARALFFLGLVCLAFTAAGAASVETEADDAVQGRQLLGNQPSGGGWVWFPSQTVVQGGGNVAGWTGPGPVNQQNSQQGINQNGDWNSATNYNHQSIKNEDGPPPPKPKRKLLGDSEGQWVFWPSQTVAQFGGNYASSTGPGPVNQQNSQQGINQNGGSNQAQNINSQSIKNVAGKPDPPPNPPKNTGPWGRKLLGNQPSGGQWVWFDQTVFQGGGNYASGTGPGPVNQQNSQQGINQNGYNNWAGNSNNQSIKNVQPGKPKP